MWRLPYFQIDAFTSDRARGNPAGVVPLEEWLDDAVMQAIAAENGLSETAFLVPEGDEFALRWFAPRREVELCGHATLAAGFVVLRELQPDRPSVRFTTRSGVLGVDRDGDLLLMDFPELRLQPCPEPPEALLRGLGRAPDEVHVVESDANFVAVFDDEAAVRDLKPDLELLEGLHPHGVVATAPGSASDCASRYFAPSYGIPEDPVTGSIHCAVAPYWSRRLGKARLVARQVSPRGGELVCEVVDDRVRLAGRAVKYLEGHIHVPESWGAA